MHEISIATELAESVEKEARTRGLATVEAVHLRLGRLSGVDLDALDFAFSLVVQGTPLEGVRLIVEQVAIEARCSACGKTRVVSDASDLRCPQCRDARQEILQGREIELAALEVAT